MERLEFLSCSHFSKITYVLPTGPEKSGPVLLFAFVQVW